MATIDKYNFAHCVEKQLTENLQEVLIERLTNTLIADFSIYAKSIVTKEVEKVAISHVERMCDLAELRDEIKIYCEWKEADDG